MDSWLIAIALLCGNEINTKVQCQTYLIKCSKTNSVYVTPNEPVIANCYLDWSKK